MIRLQVSSKSPRRHGVLGPIAVVALGVAALAADSRAGVPGPFPRTRAALDAAVDSYAVANVPTHALWLEGIATDFIYDAPGTLIEYANGTARLVGRVHSASNPGLQFLADVNFTGRTIFGNASYPPLGSPKLELK